MNAGSRADRLYRAEQVRLLDRAAIEQMSVSGFELMMRAGKATFRQLFRRWPQVRSLTLFCGGGNNGGDGYVIAGLAHRQGLAVQLFYLSEPQKLKGEAAEARDWAQALGVEFKPWCGDAAIDGELVVDAMLGTGLAEEVRGAYREAMAAINNAGRPVVAVDIPSGLSSDTGVPLGMAVRADLTVSFIGLKQGLLTGSGPDFSGELAFDDLGVAEEVLDSIACSSVRITWDRVRSRIAPRRPCAHKGEFGRVLIVGGDEGMGGAAMLAAEAAARSGAGLVYAATQKIHIPAFLARCPEVMVKAVRSRQELAPLLELADAVVIGPGLGQGAWSQQMLQAALESDKALVLDADALNLIAAQGLARQVRGLKHVMTPHPGEASRLLGWTVSEIQTDRFEAVARLQAEYGGVVLLKGAGTLICGGANASVPVLVQAGNPGMATGGMGDVLSGILGAFLAQGFEAREATELAACLHGEAARVAAVDFGYISLLPTDLVAALPKCLRDSDPRSQQKTNNE